MQTGFSQQKFVTQTFWVQVKACECYADLSIALIEFNKCMILQDKNESRDSENRVMELLRRAFGTMIAEDMGRSDVFEIFNKTALIIAGVVLSSAAKDIPSKDLRKELAVYFGVTGAKRLLGLVKTPTGFKSRGMFPALFRYYKTVGRVVIHTEQMPRPSTPGLKVSDEIKSYFRRSSIRWVKERTGNWTNHPRRLDSRSQEYIDFLAFLLSTPYRDENMFVFINQLWPNDPKYDIPKWFTRDPGSKETSITVIKNSPLCLQLDGFYPHSIFAQFGPVKDALPFILKNLTDPPQHVHESGIPRGCYTFTLVLMFEDWDIHIDTFRC